LPLIDFLKVDYETTASKKHLSSSPN